MRLALKSTTYFAFGLILSTLLSCTTQLAPSYDKALFDGITRSNAQIMTLFASASAGTQAESFAKREPIYNMLIGNIDALALQSKARPVPPNPVTNQVNDYLASRGIAPMDDGEAPSAASLEKVSESLTVMRNKDKADGLTPTAVALFKNQVVISMDQALTYEAFLKR